MKKIQKNIVWILLFTIIVLAGVLRFWQLGKVPLSPDWDEVSLGYNAYSIMHTGRDEYGKLLPIVLESFGDYKPALYSYLSIPSIAVFGLNVFAVRFPSAVFGILTVLAVFFLIKELFKRNDIALLSTFLLAISPWHVQFSRVAFETNVGLAFNVFGALFFLKGFKKPWLLTLSALFFGLNLYVYQSEKVFTPLLFLLLVAIYWKDVWKLPKKYLITAGLLGLLIILPMVSYTALNKNGLARAEGVSILSPTSDVSQENARRYLYDTTHHDIIGLVLDNRRFTYIKAALGNYLSHFDVNWLFITGDIGRHHAPDMGLMYLWEMPFLFMGLYWLFFGKYNVKTKLTIFGWFLLAPVPAAITTGVPHAVRTLNFLPTFQIFTALGVLQAILFFKNRTLKNVPYGVGIIGIVVLFALFNFVYYLDQYFVQTNYFAASSWLYGYEKIIPATEKLANSYHTVLVTDKAPLDQSYIFFLFYMQYDPKLYQQQAAQPSEVHHFGKYVFRPLNWPQDSQMKNTLIVGNAQEFPDNVSGTVQTIYNVDGTPFAKIVGE